MYAFISNQEVDGEILIGNYKHEKRIFITPWTIAHFIVGYLCHLFGFHYLSGFVIHTIYEYLNYSNEYIKRKWKRVYSGFKCDSVFNSVGDTIFFMLGMILAKNYRSNVLNTIIFIIGVIFYSPHLQRYLTNNRLFYLEKKMNIKMNHTQELDYSIFILWIVCYSVLLLKEKILL